MADLILAIQTYAGWLYGLLALLLLGQLVTMWRAGRERELALFDLERQAATGKAVRAFVTLLLLVTIGAGVYSVATVIAPSLPADARRANGTGPLVVPAQLSEPPTAEATASPTALPTRAPRIVTPTVSAAP